jgi:asparagine synthase (glutamine-hydrolysing)
VGGTLLFGSELKALRAHPSWHPEIDRNALALYLRYSYVPAPHTIYKGICKAPPGKILSFSGSALEDPSSTTFWSALEVAENGLSSPTSRTEQDLVETCDELLRTAIAQQMVADVPLGAFLSGGIDSSLVVALMQAQSTTKVKTFTIGFHEKEYNEADHAEAVAQHLGTEHTQFYVTPRDSLDVIPKLAEMYDEPFADASQIPTFLLARLARQQVTVSLSGDGGDELFGGYSRYFLAPPIWRRTRSIPPILRGVLSRALMSVSVDKWDQLFAVLAPGIPTRYRRRKPGYRLHKLGRALGFENPQALYRMMVSSWVQPSEVVLGANEPATVLTDSSQWLKRGNVLDQMMYLDSVSYLPDDILVKVDRATMAVSLESRAPFLDHEIAEFAWQLPQVMKVRGGKGKWILRKVLGRYVPQNLIERPKMGFGVPIDHWLRGPLRDWGEALLHPARLASEGFFDSASIQIKWSEHQSGARNWQYPLWGVLMFQSWLESQSAASLHSAA